MIKILVTGANSYIGTSFEKYIQDNYQNDYIVDTVDMIDGNWKAKNFSGYDTIFHVSGIAHQKETKENVSIYYKVNCDLAIETAQKAKEAGVKQFLYLSSMSVYGLESGVITKDTPLNPNSNYGKSKLMAENALMKLVSEDFCVAIVRPPMVYGLGCRGNFNSLVSLVKKLPVFPKIKNKRSMIYIDNLSCFIKMVIDRKLSGFYMPQNKEYVNTSDMAMLIAEQQGKTLYMSKFFAIWVKILFPFVSVVRKAFGSLVYDKSLETLDFEYCIVHMCESIKDSIKEVGKTSEW